MSYFTYASVVYTGILEMYRILRREYIAQESAVWPRCCTLTTPQTRHPAYSSTDGMNLQTHPIFLDSRESQRYNAESCPEESRHLLVSYIRWTTKSHSNYLHPELRNPEYENVKLLASNTLHLELFVQQNVHVQSSRAGQLRCRCKTQVLIHYNIYFRT